MDGRDERPIVVGVDASDSARAAAERADGARMLVLGSYGEGTWSGMLAGTVALTQAGHVPCPVAVIRGGRALATMSSGGGTGR